MSAMKGGIGSAAVTLRNGLVVAAIVATNGFGDVVDPASGAIVAGARTADGKGFRDARRLLRTGEIRFATPAIVHPAPSCFTGGGSGSAATISGHTAPGAHVFGPYASEEVADADGAYSIVAPTGNPLAQSRRSGLRKGGNRALEVRFRFRFAKG